MHRDPSTFLRDEQGLLVGPGAKAGLSWQDIEYPSAEEPTPMINTITGRRKPKLWADEYKGAAK
jgi:hypothetical protein